MDSYETVIGTEAETWSYSKLIDHLWPRNEHCDGPVVALAGHEDPSKFRKLELRYSMRMITTSA